MKVIAKDLGRIMLQTEQMFTILMTFGVWTFKTQMIMDLKTIEVIDMF